LERTVLRHVQVEPRNRRRSMTKQFRKFAH
jgi:hypothetical protein